MGLELCCLAAVPDSCITAAYLLVHCDGASWCFPAVVRSPAGFFDTNGLLSSLGGHPHTSLLFPVEIFPNTEKKGICREKEFLN